MGTSKVDELVEAGVLVEEYNEPQGDDAAERLATLLSALRALTLHYRTQHWKVVGDSSYGDHLLYERLYESVQEHVDTLAEKMVGFFEPDAVSLSSQMPELGGRLNEMAVPDGTPIVQWSIEMQEKVLDMIRATYDVLDRQDDLSIGLDDFLMATANKHEEHLYLLRQRNR